MTEFNQLQSVLGFQFSDASLLKQALVHSSFLNENPDLGVNDNERMEFLGDSLLNLIVAESIYHEFPDYPEGKLTEIRVTLTRQEKLAEKAFTLKLGDYMLLGRGENASGGRMRRNNLADAFEALLAAIYLDQGIDVTRKFILKIFHEDIKDIKSGEIKPNFKALLQEYTQGKYRALPEYEIIESTGPDHDRVFHVSISLNDVVLAIGTGKSKKAAESHAARLAYEKLCAKA